MLSTGTQAPLSRGGSSWLFNLFLIYLFLFYSQIGSRIPALGAIRLEFLVGCFLLIIVFYQLLSGGVTRPHNRLLSYIIFYFCVLILSIPFAFVRGYALEMFIRCVKFAAIFLMIVVAIDDEQKLTKFLWWYVAFIAIIYIEPFTWAIQGQGFKYNSGAMRLCGYGLWGHPNSLGGVTVSNLPFLYYLFLYEKSNIKKIILLSLMAISLAVIMFSSSRTALVGLIFLSLIIWLQSKRKMLGLGLVIVFLVASWQMAPHETKAKFITLEKASRAITSQDSVDSMDQRMEILKHSWEVYKEHPIIGVGIGNFVNVNGTQYGLWMPTHNLYTQVLSEIGTLGAIAFFLIVYQIFRNLKDTKNNLNLGDINKNSIIEFASKAVFCFLLMRLLVGFFGDDLMENYWWIAGGLSMCMLDLSKKMNTHQESDDFTTSYKIP